MNRFYIALILCSIAVNFLGCQAVLKSSPKLDTLTIKYPKATIVIIPDSDKDGVTDDIDACPGTVLGEPVDDRGCHFTMGPDRHLKMEIRVFYDKGSSLIKSEYQAELAKAAQFMQNYPEAVLMIQGSVSTNEVEDSKSLITISTLARDRAVGIKNYLVLDHQVNSGQIMTFDCGDKLPITPDNTEEGRAMNRRVYAVLTNDEDLIDRRYEKYPYACIGFFN